MADVIEIDAVTGEVIHRDFTAEEIAQRNADMAAAAIQAAADALTSGNKATIESRAMTALTTNRDFLALASPTNAEALAQIKALTHQNVAIIRLLLGALEGVD